MTDLSVEFDVPSGFQALQAPTKLPTLFDGDKAVIYGIFKSKASSDEPLKAGVQGTATLRGQVVGEPLEFKIPFEIPEQGDSQPLFDLPIIHQLASKSLIVDWQNKEGWSGTVSEEERKKEIVKLSVESSVLSSHTAYIAVDEEQDKPIEGAVKTWDLTAENVLDEDLQADLLCFAAAPCARNSAFNYLASSDDDSFNSSDEDNSASGSEEAEEEMEVKERALPPPKFRGKKIVPAPSQERDSNSPLLVSATKGRAAATSGLTLLISLQQAEGFWQLDSLATKFLNKNVADFSARCPSGCSSDVWATLLALACLETRFSSQQDEWELVAMKADMWLESQSLPDSIEKLKQAAKKCV